MKEVQVTDKLEVAGSNGDWVTWRRLVLQQLKDAKAERKELLDQVWELKTKVAVLQTKMLLIATVASLITASVVATGITLLVG